MRPFITRFHSFPGPILYRNHLNLLQGSRCHVKLCECFLFESLISGLVEGLGMSHDIFSCECRNGERENSFRILKLAVDKLSWLNFLCLVAIHYILYSLFLGALETDLPKGVANPVSREWGARGVPKTKYGLKQLSSFQAFWQHKHHRYCIYSCIYIHWSTAPPSQKFTIEKHV